MLCWIRYFPIKIRNEKALTDSDSPFGFGAVAWGHMEDSGMSNKEIWILVGIAVFVVAVIGSFIWIMVKNPEMWERFKKGDDGYDGRG